MDSVARRTRRGAESRSSATVHGGERRRSSAGGSGARSRAFGTRMNLGPGGDGPPAAPPPPDLVIVLDGDEEVTGEGGDGGGGGGECRREDSLEKRAGSREASVTMRTRSLSRSVKSPVPFGRRTIIVSSDSERAGSEASDLVRGGEADDHEVAARAGDDQGVEESNYSKDDLSAPSFVGRITRSQSGKQTRVSYIPQLKVEESNYSEENKEEDDNGEEDDKDDETYEEEDNVEADNTETTASGKEEECMDECESLGVSLKKRRFSGIEILVPISSSSKENTDNECTISSGSNGVAQRTRSHFYSEASKKKNNKKKKQQLGTIGNPYQVDVDKSGSEFDSGSSSSEGEDDEGGHSEAADKMDVDGGKGETAKKGLRGRKSNKRKGAQALKADSLFKLLVNTILNDPNKLPEGQVPPTDNCPPQEGVASCHEDMLPLVFSFGDEDPKPVEKSEQERAVDELWADFDFAMESINIGANQTNEQEAVEVHVPEAEGHSSSFCSEGDHQLIFDEQVGYLCKLCSVVVKEIKDILPCWAKRVREISDRKSYVHEMGPSIFDDFCAAVKDSGGQRPSHLLEGTVWDLIPGLNKTLYQHQREAFEFMWQNLVGGVHLNQLKSCAKSDRIGGCVISHAPGTGKTRLTIVFIQTYMKVFPECRPVIVAPCGMLLTWEKEFKKWDVDLPFHVLNVDEYSGNEDDVVCELVQKESRNKKWIRIVKLYSWVKGNSILGLSYGLFKRLTDERTSKNLNSREISKILFEKPGLLVLDEGHTPRNDDTLIWKTLEKVKTEQRIILSGTPFQNNFAELYNTLCLVRPKFAEKITPKTLKLYQRSAELLSDNVPDIFSKRNQGKGKWTFRANYVNDDSLEELRMMIKPFVHVYDGKILEKLPGLRDCIILLDPLPQQKSILKKIDDIRSSSNFEHEYKISLATVHPSLLTSAVLSEKEKSFVDEHLLEKLRLNPNEGVKTRFVMEMVRLSEALKEKVVVFSQFLQPLSMIRDQLIKHFNWIEGKEVLQMDGKMPSKHRQSSIDIFNDLSSETRVLLASTKACSEGICLTGASRVVLLDIVWNPSVERQAISRAYRIGQEKVVYTYHLITFGTGEGDKYEKQTKKNHFSKLVFSPEINLKNMKNQSSQAEEEHYSKLVSEDKILEVMTGHDELRDMFIKIYYTPKESNILHAFE